MIELASSSRALRQLLGQHAGVGERVQRVAAVPDHERLRLQRAALRAVRGDAAEEQALQHRRARARGPGARCRGGSRPPTAAPAPGVPRAGRSRISGSPTLSATISGVKASAQASSAPSSTGISITMPRSRSGASAAASSAVLAPSEVPHHDRLVDPEVVEQRDRLLRRRPSSSSRRRRRGRSELAVAEQVERDRRGCRARRGCGRAARASAGSAAGRAAARTVRGPSPYSV